MLLGVNMKGNDYGDKVISLRKDGESIGLTANHPVTTAVERLYEGITIATVVRLMGLQQRPVHSNCKPAMTNSAKSTVITLRTSSSSGIIS